MIDNAVLNIPKNIRIGFYKKDDETEEISSFIVSVRSDGNITKSKMFDQLCDKSIPFLNEKNIPMSNFILIKNYDQRVNVNGRVKFIDPRGFEFDISLKNFSYLLNYGNIIDLSYSSKCVYSWNRNELVLIPINSEAYQINKIKSDKKEDFFEEDKLVVGENYKFKNNHRSLLYLGKYFHIYNQRFLSYKENFIDKLKKDQNFNIYENGYLLSKKERFLFVGLNEYKMADLFCFDSLKNIEDISYDEKIFNNMEIENILKHLVISKTPFEFKTDHSDFDEGKIYYFEDEDYEYYIHNEPSIYGYVKKAHILDKNKLKWLKYSNISVEIENKVKYFHKKINKDTELKVRSLDFNGNHYNVIID